MKRGGTKYIKMEENRVDNGKETEGNIVRWIFGRMLRSMQIPLKNQYHHK
jgi:hypothetical protein